MNTIDQWLTLCEQHARLIATAKMLKDTDQVVTNFKDRDALSEQIRPLWFALLDAGHTVADLDARYNERVKPILGREVRR